MKPLTFLSAAALVAVTSAVALIAFAAGDAPASLSASSDAAAAVVPNPRIDYPAFERTVGETGSVRAGRRLTEDAFLELMRRPGVLVLDARTESRYRRLHIKGAVNLPFTEFTAESLAAAIPGFDTPVLIYCNNNFADRLDAFPAKLPAASLNVSTFAALRTYGYENVYELGPLLRVGTSRLPFAGDAAPAGTAPAGR